MTIRGCLIISSLMCAVVFLQAKESEPEIVFQGYLESIIAGNYKQAESYWRPQDIQSAQRLGITYSGVPLKFDCASPIVHSLEALRNGTMKVNIIETSVDGNRASLKLQISSEKSSTEVVYYILKEDSAWKLASSITYYTSDWYRIESRYANIIFHDSSLVNVFAIEALDDFIDSLGIVFDVSKKRMNQLQEQKIDYVLCSEPEIETITGYPAQGIANLQFDAVITRHLPHYHEIVHLMVNFALENLPLYTIPFLQEGTAVCFGGRWGKSPEVIMQMGEFTLENELFDLKDALTYRDFHQKIGNADFSYPLSAIIVRTIFQNSTSEEFKKLYLNLSGSAEDVQNFDIYSIMKIITEITGQKWSEIENTVTDNLPEYKYSGIYPGLAQDTSNVVTELECEGIHVRIFDADDVYQFQIALTAGNSGGKIIFKDPELKVQNEYRSWVFTEQVAAQEYSGEKYGVIFNAAEAGLYDFHTNILLAKYVYNFAPSPEYRICLRSPTDILNFAIDKSLFYKNITKFDLQLVK